MWIGGIPSVRFPRWLEIGLKAAIPSLRALAYIKNHPFLLLGVLLVMAAAAHMATAACSLIPDRTRTVAAVMGYTNGERLSFLRDDHGGKVKYYGQLVVTISDAAYDVCAVSSDGPATAQTILTVNGKDLAVTLWGKNSPWLYQTACDKGSGGHTEAMFASASADTRQKRIAMQLGDTATSAGLREILAAGDGMPVIVRAREVRFTDESNSPLATVAVYDVVILVVEQNLPKMFAG